MSESANIYVIDTSAWLALIEDEAGKEREFPSERTDHPVVCVSWEDAHLHSL